MPKVSDIKKGFVADIDGKPYVVKSIDVKSPSSRGASTLYKFKLTAVQGGHNLQLSHKGDEQLQQADVVRRQCQFLFKDTDSCTFMDNEDYAQYTLASESIENELAYLVDGLEGIYALLIDGHIAMIELPQSVELEITETAPALKGATASGRTKSAMLSTGLEIQVPEYLATGDRVKVNTVTAKFMSRC